MKALVLENIHPTAAEILSSRGYEVDLRVGALPEDELADSLTGVSLLGIRSNTEKLTRFALEGSTALAVNLPPVLPPPMATSGRRLGYLHRNVPGVLADLNAAFAAAGDNVVDQHLSTRDDLGYVVTDATEPPSADTVQDLRRSEHCLWARTW